MLDILLESKIEKKKKQRCRGTQVKTCDQFELTCDFNSQAWPTIPPGTVCDLPKQALAIPQSVVCDFSKLSACDCNLMRKLCYHFLLRAPTSARSHSLAGDIPDKPKRGALTLDARREIGVDEQTTKPIPIAIDDQIVEEIIRQTLGNFVIVDDS
eukprot:Gb_13382 [translate_table: standard]